MKFKCEECNEEINTNENLENGEIITCPHCGIEYEVKIKCPNIEIIKLEIQGEDWGE